MRFAEGDNFRIDVERGHARCKVWRRPDLDSAAGAAAAEQTSQLLGELASNEDVRSLVFDLRVAPGFMGPRTQRAIGNAFSAFEQVRKPMAVVSAAAVQGLQLQRVLGLNAPLYGRVFNDLEEAVAWVESFRGP